LRYQLHFRADGFLRPDVLIHDAFEIIDEFQGRGAISLQPGVSSVPHDRQHPCARVAIDEIADRAVRVQTGLLHDVLGICGISSKPTRQRMGIRKMRQHDAVEALTMIS
jgi:hypothetical protein